MDCKELIISVFGLLKHSVRIFLHQKCRLFGSLSGFIRFEFPEKQNWNVGYTEAFRERSGLEKYKLGNQMIICDSVA